MTSTSQPSSSVPPVGSSTTTFRAVLHSESAAILAAAERVGAEIEIAIDLLRNVQGRVVFSGMGKTGYIARKAAATFCSTGLPAIFLHPSEALHGDLGVVTAGDILIVVSNSGETEDVLALLPFMARLNVPVIAVTGNKDSSLALRSTVILDASVASEADQISITPTNSTTVAMAMCDALAVALMTQRGFTKEQFAIFHPGGNLGRKLLLQVGDLMRVGDSVPTIPSGSSLREAIETISAKRLGAVFVLSAEKRLIGILTDGDLRRAYQNQLTDPSASPLEQPISKMMTASPKSIRSSALAAEAMKLMEDHKITVLSVVDADDKLVGAIHLHDLIRAGLA